MHWPPTPTSCEARTLARMHGSVNFAIHATPPCEVHASIHACMQVAVHAPAYRAGQQIAICCMPRAASSFSVGKLKLFCRVPACPASKQAERPHAHSFGGMLALRVLHCVAGRT